MAEDRFVTLGVITGAHGTRGAVKVKPFTESPEGLLDYPLQDDTGKRYALTCIGEAKGQLICQVKGIRYRDEAEKLKGTELGVMRSTLPEPDADEFYIEDLIGMQVQLEDGTPYGTVKAVHNFGAGDVVAISTSDGEELLPFSDQTVPSINIDEGRLTIHLPDIIKGES